MSEFRLLSKNFVLACAATFLYFGSFYLMMPVLPQFVISLHGTSGQVGLVVGFMTLTSVLVRPYFGRLSDRRGRRLVMLLGALSFAVIFIGYMLVDGVRPLYFLRITHGVAHGAMLAALFAFVADLAPAQRRGEVMGIHGVSNVLAMALFPAVGAQFINATGNFNGLFMISLVSGALACLCVLFTDNLRPVSKQGEGPRLGAVFLNPAVTVASLTYMGAAILYGATITFLPIYGPQQNVGNVGVFFTVYAAFTFVSRLSAGRLSDRHGRAVVIIPALCLTAAGGFALVFLNGMPLLVLAGACFGLGFGGFMPALNAFVVDNTNLAERSMALAVYTSFMDVGMTIGAMLFGLIGGLVGYSGMFLAAAVVTCCGTALFTVYQKRARRQ